MPPTTKRLTLPLLVVLYYVPQEEPESAPWFMNLIALSIVIMIFYSAYKIIFGSIKEALGLGTFSKFFKPTAENKRLAFAVLGAHIIVAEPDMYREKYSYLSSYLRRYFPKLRPLPNDEIFQKHKIYKDFLRAAHWSAHSLSETEQINLLDFLIELGFQNQSLNRRETSYIYHVGRALKFPDSEISSMLNMRYMRQEKIRNHREQSSHQSSSRKSTVEHQTLKALKILGLPTKIKDLEEVRKAYRNLARKHHPDRYHNASEEEQKLAHERFTEINWAHDFLKERLG
jgi:DnaJ like chaperone protein